MTIDFRELLRRLKPEKRLAQLQQRLPEQLEEWTVLIDRPRAGFVPDTTVYIHDAADRLPAQLSAILDNSLLFHCSVALAELSTGVANADPTLPSWPALRDHYAELFTAIPDSRILTPDAQVLLDAGLIAGTLARTQRLQRHQRREMLNDALIFLTAAKTGMPVLTASRDQFDLIQQIAPEGRFVHY